MSATEIQATPGSQEWWTMVQHELARPFTPAAIRLKPQVVSKTKPEAMVTFYVDGRLAAARLNTVVGLGAWEDSYRVVDSPQLGLPVECRLTVGGVTKADVGQIAPTGKVDDKAFKSAYSDAFKRAAVKWGVGAYLYVLPKVWCEVVLSGEGDRRQARGLTANGERAAKDAYVRWLASDANVFGDPLDHGDQEPTEEEAAAAAAAETEARALVEKQVAGLIERLGKAAAALGEPGKATQVVEAFKGHGDIEWLERATVRAEDAATAKRAQAEAVRAEQDHAAEQPQATATPKGRCEHKWATEMDERNLIVCEMCGETDIPFAFLDMYQVEGVSSQNHVLWPSSELHVR